MDTIYKNNGAKCPSATEYQKYFSGSGSATFISSFENHLKNCELCTEAIEGYKLSYLVNDYIELPKVFGSIAKARKEFYFKRFIPYAASVAIFISLVFTTPLKNYLFKNNYLAHESYMVKTNYNKKLMHKTNTEYWYISESNHVSINDQLVPNSDLQASVKVNAESDMVFVQVESNNDQTTEQVISKIKENNSVPVYTYSKHKGLKKN